MIQQLQQTVVADGYADAQVAADRQGYILQIGVMNQTGGAECVQNGAVGLAVFHGLHAIGRAAANNQLCVGIVPPGVVGLQQVAGVDRNALGGAGAVSAPIDELCGKCGYGGSQQISLLLRVPAFAAHRENQIHIALCQSLIHFLVAGIGPVLNFRFVGSRQQGKNLGDQLSDQAVGGSVGSGFAVGHIIVQIAHNDGIVGGHVVLLHIGEE